MRFWRSKSSAKIGDTRRSSDVSNLSFLIRQGIFYLLKNRSYTMTFMWWWMLMLTKFTYRQDYFINYSFLFTIWTRNILLIFLAVFFTYIHIIYDLLHRISHNLYFNIYSWQVYVFIWSAMVAEEVRSWNESRELWSWLPKGRYRITARRKYYRKGNKQEVSVKHLRNCFIRHLTTFTYSSPAPASLLILTSKACFLSQAPHTPHPPDVPTMSVPR